MEAHPLPSPWNRPDRIGLIVNVATAVGLAAGTNVLLFLGWAGAVAGPPRAQPGWAPPGAVVGTVWMVLFGLIGAARWAVLRTDAEGRVRASRWIVGLILLCLAFPFYTAGPSGLEIGLAGTLVTIAVALVTVRAAWRTGGLGAALLAPLVAWLAFATILIAATLRVNAAVPRTDQAKLERLESMVAEVESRFPEVERWSVSEVGRLLEADSVVLVDVRTPEERAISRIPGSITAEAFEADPARYNDVAVVAYCTIGYRSSEYAERLAAEGHEVANLRGSILAWAHARGPLVGPDGPTRRLHVFGPAWDLAPGEYETVW